MAFNAAKFRSFMQYGGARPNLYKVTLTFPPGTTTGSDTDEAFTFLCKSASLPGMRMGTAQASYFGRKINFAGDREFEPWSVSLYTDEDFKVRNALEAWQNRMSLLDHDTNAIDGMCDQKTFYVDISVTQLGKDGNLCGHGEGDGHGGLKTYTLKNAFPTDIGQIALAYDSNDTIAEYEVTFTYDYFLSDRLQKHEYGP